MIPSLVDKPVVLVVAPLGRDAAVIAQVLAPAGHEVVACRDLADLTGRLGPSALAAVVTEEALREGDAQALEAWISAQPPWSDFPFIILAARTAGSGSLRGPDALRMLGNAVVLERPLNVVTLVSAVDSSVRSRRRQYQARSHLQQQEAIGEENRRLYEAERRARAEADSANRAKDEFLATLSHELRTPLSAILGWTYVLQQRRADLGDMARGVDTIERNAKAQARLIEDLLDMSRIVAGKVILETQAVVPGQLVDGVVVSLDPMARAKNVTVVAGLESAMTPIVGDPQRLQQVIRNLLTNAIKFTPDGGAIEVGAVLQDGELVIRVHDNGIGIDPAFLPHVFDRFRQADGTTTRSQGGLGLGLAIVRRLVELHGGSVSATSAGTGAGSTFTVRLPAREVGAGDALVHGAEGAATPPGASPLRDIRVLLVEDDDDGREMVERLLADQGARVRMVESATLALAALGEEAFDIVVSDIGMPEVDGYELLTRIRSAGNAVPAIALTAFARLEDEARARQAGYSRHLSKPVEPPALIAAIAELASGEDEGATRRPRAHDAVRDVTAAGNGSC